MQRLTTSDRTAERLPALGPRGEGWFAGQLLLMAAVTVAALLGPDWGGAARLVTSLVGVALVALGGAIGIRAVLDLRTTFTPLPRPLERGRLVESGVYGLVRHPMYLAVVLGGLGWSLATASPAALAGTVALLAFLDLKSRREEAWLVEAYPEDVAYRRRTSRLVPGIY